MGFLRYLIKCGLYHDLVYRWFGGRHRVRVMHDVSGRSQRLKEIARGPGACYGQRFLPGRPAPTVETAESIGVPESV